MVESISPLASSQAAANQKSGEKNASPLSSDFETFLKMLTAQARYQDPLEPIDSTEYAAQLAQFSMVEQQVKTNDTLQELSTHLGGANLSSVADWVGKSARSAAPAYFNGSPLEVFAPLAEGADQGQLVVRNDAGEEVQRLPHPGNGDTFIWSGQAKDGTLLPPGHYTLTVESVSKDKVISTEPVQTYGRVVEVQAKSGKTLVTFEGGKMVETSQVTGLKS